MKRTMYMYAHRTYFYKQIDCQIHVTTLCIYAVTVYIHAHNNPKHLFHLHGSFGQLFTYFFSVYLSHTPLIRNNHA